MASKIASSSRTLLQSHSRPIPQIIYSSISNTHTHPLLPLNTPRSQYHSTPLRSQIPCPRIKVPSHQLKRRSYTTAPTYTTATNSLLSSTTNGPPPIHNQGTGVRVVPPNLELIKQEGYFDEDVSLVPEGEARLIITPQALNVGYIQFCNVTPCIPFKVPVYHRGFIPDSLTPPLKRAFVEGRPLN